MVSGLSPVSHGYRCAGFGSTSVYGPGRRASGEDAGSPPQLGDALEQRVDAGRDERHRLRRRTALQLGEPVHGLLAIGRARQAVHGVRRDHGEPARADRGRHLLDLAHPAATPSTTRSRPVRSCVISTSANPRSPSSAGDPLSVTVGDLQHEPASAFEHVTSALRHRLRGALGEERHARLPVADLGSEGHDLSGADVGRVRHDEVPRPRRQAREEVVLEELDREPRPRGVLARQRQRVDRGVDAGDAGARVLVRDREGDRPAPDAHVEDARRHDTGDRRHAALDDDLRLGARHERARVDREHEPPKAPLPEHVGEGLARRPALGEPVELVGLVRRERAVAVREHPRPRRPEDVGQQQLRVDARRVAPGRREPVADARQSLTNGHAKNR